MNMSSFLSPIEVSFQRIQHTGLTPYMTSRVQARCHFPPEAPRPLCGVTILCTEHPSLWSVPLCSAVCTFVSPTDWDFVEDRPLTPPAAPRGLPRDPARKEPHPRKASLNRTQLLEPSGRAFFLPLMP